MLGWRDRDSRTIGDHSRVSPKLESQADHRSAVHGTTIRSPLSMFHGRGLRPTIRHRTTSYEVVRTLVGRGLGYGVLVQRLNNTSSYEGYSLVVKEIEPAVEPVGVEVIWPSQTAIAMRVQALIEFALARQWKTA
ncbi:LysR substrate-binding domain-containing protein [Brevibacterium aurantiacum]|uniref:LysR substrate-binding domain-containing protein n=1 Tax=Brevibacterium aurantiacum TaxID=273384 RepID=UPI0023AF6209|nr:LysR substrate-binding domain-containing protein [Brevibacterium aurantiacum]